MGITCPPWFSRVNVSAKTMSMYLSGQIPLSRYVPACLFCKCSRSFFYYNCNYIKYFFHVFTIIHFFLFFLFFQLRLFGLRRIDGQTLGEKLICRHRSSLGRPKVQIWCQPWKHYLIWPKYWYGAYRGPGSALRGRGCDPTFGIDVRHEGSFSSDKQNVVFWCFPKVCKLHMYIDM